MTARSYWVYILASDSGTLYIGVTNNLERRLVEHREGLADGFTKKYSCKKLVYFEETSDVYAAISRERQLKNWGQKKKELLIRTLNPIWKDLAEETHQRI